MTEQQDGRTLSTMVERMSSAPMGRRRLLRGGAVALGAAALSPLLGACGSNATTASANTSAPAAATAASAAAAATTPTQPASAPAASAAPTEIDAYLTIVTGEMIGKPDWPAYLPSDVRIPANSEVTFRVVNFDDADDMSAANLVQYTKVQGTVGNTVTIAPIKDDDPNKEAGSPQTLAQLDPKNGVSHTFTSAQLKLNVPVAPHGVTMFKVKTGAPGTFYWECHVPCGTDPAGFAGPMVTSGYMHGTIVVV